MNSEAQSRKRPKTTLPFTAEGARAAATLKAQKAGAKGVLGFLGQTQRQIMLLDRPKLAALDI